MRSLSFCNLDELLKAYKILEKVGADDKLTSIVFRELLKRGIDVGVETRQEVLQEAATIAGVQAGTKLDTGEWAYSFGDVTDRLWDTAKESALTFTLTNVPTTVHNVTTQNHNRLVAAGEANILAGKMPTPEQLYAMNMTEAEALGKMVVIQMDELEDVDVGQNGSDTIQNNNTGTDTKLYTPVEYTGTVKVNGEVRDVSRRVYQRRDIDFEYSDAGTGMTNLERMLAGQPPIGSDGRPIQLHHILQVEKGPMVEILEVTHKQYFSQLYGLIGQGDSFRNDPVLKNQYNNFRRNYWKWRANQILGGDQ